MFLTLTGFLLSLAVILIFSKKNLGLSIIAGGVVLGIFTLPVKSVIQEIINVIKDLSILFLTIAMGIIPLIGGVMKKSGEIDSLIKNLRINKRYLLPLSAALMGLLPMPGGALLSAPILEKGGEGVKNELKAAINNWFRHVFILIYPLSPPLIASAKMVKIDVYHAVLFLLPSFFISSLLGFIFFLLPVKGKAIYKEKFSLKGLLIPLLIILSAPIIDFSFRGIFPVRTLATFCGVIIALLLAFIFKRNKIEFKKTFFEMKPWNFSLIILGMFIYLFIFEKTEVGKIISLFPLPPLTLCVIFGFILGFFTGRVQLPVSIIFPVYLSMSKTMNPFSFSLLYSSIFFGYIASPVHPCLVVTCEYFKVPVKDLIKKMLLPALIIFLIILLISVFR